MNKTEYNETLPFKLAMLAMIIIVCAPLFYVGVIFLWNVLHMIFDLLH